MGTAGNCRACGARIRFLTTKAGKHIPIDIDTYKDGDQTYDHTRHKSHFASCPEAARFRKPRA